MKNILFLIFYLALAFIVTIKANNNAKIWAEISKNYNKDAAPRSNNDTRGTLVTFTITPYKLIEMVYIIHF